MKNRDAIKKYFVWPKDNQDDCDCSTINDDLDSVVIHDGWDDVPADEQNPSDSDDD